tara:strand:- start:1114 stop:1278 length:165 start_codon:yes stop_codon:yes gene_type:complete
MSRGIRDIEECFDLLRKAKEIFSDLSGDSMVDRSRMSRWCARVDKLIYEIEEEE